MGICHGVGTTHLSLMTANYFANVLGLKVAVVEFNDSNDFMKIRMETGLTYEKIKAFSYRNMYFYKSDSFNELAKISAMDYEIIIIDMQYWYKDCFDEFLCSDIRIVTSSVNIWKLNDLKKFFVNNKDIDSSVYKCVSLSNDESKKHEVEHEFNRKIIGVPYEPNPFNISPDSIAWIEMLLFNNKTKSFIS